MARIRRMLFLVTIGALCLVTIHCDDDGMSPKVRALRVDNSTTAQRLGVRVGATIPLICINGGNASGWHQFTSCECEHLHGDISVPALNRSSTDSNAFLCGHGCVVTLKNTTIDC